MSKCILFFFDIFCVKASKVVSLRPVSHCLSRGEFSICDTIVRNRLQVMPNGPLNIVIQFWYARFLIIRFIRDLFATLHYTTHFRLYVSVIFRKLFLLPYSMYRITVGWDWSITCAIICTGIWCTICIEPTMVGSHRSASVQLSYFTVSVITIYNGDNYFRGGDCIAILNWENVHVHAAAINMYINFARGA